MDTYVFIVGKSDPSCESIDAIRALGYRVGIFYDALTPPKDTSIFDKVIPVDFSQLDTTLTTIIPGDIHIAGLQCTYENYIIAKAKIGEYLHLPTISIESAKISTDKFLMRQAFANNCPEFSPRFSLVTTIDEVIAFARTTTYPVIIKPTNLVKSLLVMRCNNEVELVKNFTFAQQNITQLYEKYNIRDRTPQLIIEEFLHGKSCSIAAFVDHTGEPHFCEGIVGLTTAAEHGADDTYLYCRTVPLEVNDQLRQSMFAAARAGIKALGMRSVPAHVELMYTDNDVKIIEIGARIGGYRPRMYAHSYGLDLAQQEIRLAVGKLPELSGTLSAYSAVFELFSPTEGAFESIDGTLLPTEVTYYNVKAKPGQLTGPSKQGYKTAAIIIVVDTDKQQFEQTCQKVDRLSVKVAS